MRVLTRAAGTAALIVQIPRERRVPYLPQQRITALRDRRVRETVAYAAATVPYYRELFGRERIDPREIRTVDDLARLPIVDKRLVYEDPERFRSTSELGRNALPLSTSGTSGLSLRVYHDRPSLRANVAYSERERAVEARLCGKRYRYTRASIGWSISTGARVRAAARTSFFALLAPQNVTLASEAPLDDLIAEINRVRPDVIWGYGSQLEMLFRYARARGAPLHRPGVLVYGSEVMRPAARRLIETAFGIPVISRYNAVEAFKLAFMCEQRDGFHVHEDLCAIRLVDEDGREVPDGERGEVVISNFVNRGTVLLNYRLGDVARFDRQACPCGRTFPRLADIEGRTGEYIRRPGREPIFYSDIEKAVKLRDEILAYQVVQRGPDEFEVNVETAGEDEFERIEDDLRAEVQRVLGDDAEIHVFRREQIEPGPAGKFKRVVSLYDPFEGL